MDESHLFNLKFALLRSRDPEPENRERYLRAHALWLKVWSPIYKRLGHGETIRSDIFTRHMEIAALFSGDEPVGIILLDAFDLTNSVDLQHSYFGQFPPEALAAFENLGLKKVLAIGNLAVAPKWRGRKAAIAEMLIAMSVIRYVHTGFDAIISYARNSMGVNQMAYRCGGEAVLMNIQAWDEPADFIVFDEESQDVLNQHPRRALMQKYWDERIHEGGRHPLFAQPKHNRLRESIQPLPTTGETYEQFNDLGTKQQQDVSRQPHDADR